GGRGPGGINVVKVGGELRVDGNAFGGIFHARLFEIETGRHRCAAAGNQQQIPANLILLRRDDDLAGFASRRFGASVYKFHTLALENVFQNLARFGLVFGQQALRNHRDLSAEALIRLGHLDAERPSANDNHAGGQAIILEDTLVSYEGDGFQPVDRRNLGVGAGRYTPTP